MPKQPKPLTKGEMSYFDGLLQGVDDKRLTLLRMRLDDKDVAVVGLKVHNRFTKKREGIMPLAVLVDEDTVKKLRDPGGGGPVSFSPHDVE